MGGLLSDQFFSFIMIVLDENLLQFFVLNYLVIVSKVVFDGIGCSEFEYDFDLEFDIDIDDIDFVDFEVDIDDNYI